MVGREARARLRRTARGRRLYPRLAMFINVRAIFIFGTQFFAHFLEKCTQFLRALLLFD